MADRPAEAYRVLSTLGLALSSGLVTLWATAQGLMQIGGLKAGGSGTVVGWLLLTYTALPLSGLIIAWWRWARHRHAEAWFALVLIGIALQFLVGSLFLQ